MIKAFRSGRTVCLRNGAQRAAARGQHKIVRSLPQEGGEREYRIKSAVEPYERIGKESELESARAPTAVDEQGRDPLGAVELLSPVQSRRTDLGACRR